MPGTSFVVLETQETFGGTWWTHKYPGIRSDSDLHTFGYSFKPWIGPPIATAAEIRAYMGEVIEENDLAKHIRYKHRILRRAGRARTNLWTIEAEKTDSGETVRHSANFLWMCQGYYRHSEGYTPEWEGMDDFKGRIVHPQTWPDDLALEGQAGRRDRLGRHRGDADPEHRGPMRACHHAAALADLFPARPQRDRDRRGAAAAAGQGGMDPRDRAAQDPVRAGCVHRRCFAEPEQVKKELLGQISAVLGPGLRRRHAFHAELPAVAAAHRLRAGRRPVPQRQGRQGLRRHRRDRPLHRERHPAEVRQDAGRRHHRHRDRLQSQCARRHRFRDRRQAARFRRHRHLSRHDVHGRSEHGLGVRLFPRQLDAAHRSGGGFRLPAARRT